MNGLMGLTTNIRTKTEGIEKISDKYQYTGDHFIESLFEQLQIEQNQFSILMTYDPLQTSSITFGGVPDFVHSLEGAVSHRVAGHEHWMLKMNDLKVGKRSITPTVQFALTDTGTSLIYLDKLDYEAVIKQICKGQKCFETEQEKNVFAIRNCEPS